MRTETEIIIVAISKVSGCFPPPFRATSRFMLILLCFCALVSCSLPRIIVLEDPLTPEEHISLGLAYERKGELDPAFEEYRRASKKLPEAFLYMGNVAFQKGDLDDAETYYRRAIRERPALADAYNNLAWLLYTRDENLAEAETLALKATELKPADENFRETLEKIRARRSGNGL